MTLAREIETALALAVSAGIVVLEKRGKASVKQKAGGEPVTEADLAANHLIVDGLKAAFPDDCVLSEELVSDETRLARSRVWIVDPIDGTREYIDGTADFAVQIGLAIDGVAVAGVVNQVAKNRLYWATAGGGAFLDDPRSQDRKARRITVSDNANVKAMRLTVSRWHRSKKHTAIQDVLKPIAVVPAGSIGVKMGLVARGEVDCYLHPSTRTAEWDTCAPDILLREAGGAVSDFFGAPLRYNQPDPHHPRGVTATNGKAHRELRALLEPTVRGFGFK